MTAAGPSHSQRAVLEVSSTTSRRETDVATAIEPHSHRRTGVRGWLPAALPAACLLLAGVLLMWSLTWLPGGRTLGQEAAQERYVRSAVIALALFVGAVWALRNADREPRWRIAAWFCSLVTAVVLVV